MHSNITIPHPVVVPATGAPTCGGVTLLTHAVAEWRRGDDAYHLRQAPYDEFVILARRAVRDGYLLCLRPTVDRPACVGLSPTQFADASLQADFAARALVVDPYDAEGNDVREYPAKVSGHVQQAVVVAEVGL